MLGGPRVVRPRLEGDLTGEAAETKETALVAEQKAMAVVWAAQPQRHCTLPWGPYVRTLQTMYKLYKPCTNRPTNRLKHLYTLYKPLVS